MAWSDIYIYNGSSYIFFIYVLKAVDEKGLKKKLRQTKQQDLILPL